MAFFEKKKTKLHIFKTITHELFIANSSLLSPFIKTYVMDGKKMSVGECFHSLEGEGIPGRLGMPRQLS